MAVPSNTARTLFRIAILTAFLCLAADAQVCRLSVAGLNRERRVMGPVSAECPHPLHTAPFGNWGAVSNFGPKLNGHQFQGWCRNMRVCDNTGRCLSNCSDGWFEWNSCTTEPAFSPPNCFLYNASDCTEQVSPTGINVLGTQTADIAVTCPRDANLDGVLDSGGCHDVRTYSRDNNFMSLYELDPLTGDELVQTLYFPEIHVPLDCNSLHCPTSGSEWVQPVSYDSPPSPPKAFAEMAMVVNSGTFLDTAGVCRRAISTLSAVSAASFESGLAVAPDSIVSLFGNGLSEATEAATSTSLPFRLAGVRVFVTDSQGARQPVPLLFVSPGQINCILPQQSALGRATIAVEDATGTRSTGTVNIDAVAPAVFTANNDGRGVPAALAVRVSSGGRQSAVDVFRCPAGPGTCEPVPIALGASSQEIFLSLFGTGLRGRTDLSNVQVTIGEASADVFYAGPQPQFPGLDQVNVRIPRSLAGAGRVELRLLVDTKPSNAVVIQMQ
jgi:uncharacterized protein (TIGR03437 family)